MRRSVPVLITLAAAATTAGALTAWLAPAPRGLSTDVPLGAVLSEQDRRDLAAPGIDRGAPAPPADPRVDFADAEAVARAYLVAAHSATPEDAGRTSLRAAPYAAPGAPAAGVGVVVVDPPPPGFTRTAVVDGIDLVAGDAGDHRRGYLATVRALTGPPGGPTTAVSTATYIALGRQPDGRWLVIGESPDAEAGED